MGGILNEHVLSKKNGFTLGVHVIFICNFAINVYNFITKSYFLNLSIYLLETIVNDL